MKQLFDDSSFDCSKLITTKYSTSFSRGIQLLDRSMQPAIYAIYGFVRYADEIVDSFQNYQQEELLLEFQNDYYKALERGISLNPILNSFQDVVNKYNIQDLVDDFMISMTKDLSDIKYTSKEAYDEYIYGSADVVGLMCLKVFVKGNMEKYEELKPYAMKLGSAFQKVNFLRDIKDDFEILGRSYFPNFSENKLDEESKKLIIQDIENDFKIGYEGILKLPNGAKLGVYLAYRYYLGLMKKIKSKSIENMLTERIRIPNQTKLSITLKSYFRYKLNMM